MDDGPSYRFIKNNRPLNAVEVTHIAPGKCAHGFAFTQPETFVFSLSGFSEYRKD